MRPIKPIRTLVALQSALLLAVALGAPARVHADPGSIWTTDSTCTDVNVKQYPAKTDVYIGGGPAGNNEKGLPAASYYVRVTSPSGTLLGVSTSAIAVTDGRFDPCLHLVEIVSRASDHTPGFDTTDNPGGEYQVDVSPESDFPNGTLKSANFKVIADMKQVCGVTCPPMVSASTDPGKCTASGVALGTPLASEGCAIVSAVNNAPAAFGIGTTTVTWTVTFADGTTAQCTQQVVVADNELPNPQCPTEMTVNNDPGQCGASVDFSVVPSDNCGVASTTYAISGQVVTPPQVLPVGQTQVDVTVTDVHSNVATCSFTVTVVDSEAPKIDCPPDVRECLQTVGGSVLNVPAATATDNCPGVTVNGVRSDGLKLTDPFPCGPTTITWTATDAHGNSTTCPMRQQVIVDGVKITAHKFFALTGTSTDVGIPVEGMKIAILAGTDKAGTAVTLPIGGIVAYTDASGDIVFGEGANGTCLPQGDYLLQEFPPASNWVATTPMQVTVTTTGCSGSAAFGNYCLVPSGGLTLGFWSNKNGQKIMTGSSAGTTIKSEVLTLLRSLNLRKADGALLLPTAASTISYSDFRAWILGATATNMANMLSAQLAAMELNVWSGGVNPDAYDLCSHRTIGQLMADAVASLGTDGSTPSGAAARAYQESLKCCLDALNNGASVIPPTPCPITTPY